MKGSLSGGPFSLSELGDLFQDVLDACPQLVALFAHEAGLGTCRRKLIPEPLDLSPQLAHSGIWTAGCRLNLGQVQPQALDGDLQLAALREQLLNERLRRLCRLFRHNDTGPAGTRAAAGAPSRRAGSVL